MTSVDESTLAPLTAPDGRSRRMPREQRREQLLDVALKIVVERGYGALSMEAVAREAEIAKTVVYTAFGNSDGILDALFERTQDRALATIIGAMPANISENPLEVVGRSLRKYLEGVGADAYAWRLILIPSDGTPPSVREAVEHHREGFRRQIEQLVGSVLDRYGVERLDRELASYTVLGAIDDLARLTLKDPERFDTERIAGYVVDLISLVIGRRP